MEAFKLVFKCFLLSVGVLLGMQLNWQGRTIESHLEILLTDSTVPKHLNQVAAGAVKFSKDSYNTIHQFIVKKIDQQSSQNIKNQTAPLTSADQSIKAEFH